MSNISQCKICKYVTIRDRIFLGRKYTCTLQNCEVDASSLCQKFTPDGNKLLQEAGFRGCSPLGDSCSDCAFLEYNSTGNGITCHCEKHNVQFWSDFSPSGRVCNNFENGDGSAAISYLAASALEEYLQDQGK